MSDGRGLENLLIDGQGWDAAIVLGSGLSGAVSALEVASQRPFCEVFTQNTSNIHGHLNEIALGRFAALKVGAFLGRPHYYQSASMESAAEHVKIAARMGARFVVLLSAVGGVNHSYSLGDWVFVEDHINLMGQNPLCGVTTKDGPPYLDLSTLYRNDLYEPIAQNLRETRLHHGVLAAFSGPTYETPSEVRMARLLGADVVGMSTVPESVWAKHLGIEVCAFGLVVNHAAGVTKQPLCHEEVVDVARGAVASAAEIISTTLNAWTNKD